MLSRHRSRKDRRFIFAVIVLALVFGTAYLTKQSSTANVTPGGKVGMIQMGAPLSANNASAPLAGPASNPAQPGVGMPLVRSAAFHDTSPPLRLMNPSPPSKPGINYEIENPIKPWPSMDGPSAMDPVVQTIAGPLVIPTPIVTFNGYNQQDNFDLYAGLGVLPPDSNGDIGPNHYVNFVNKGFRIFDRQGSLIYGPAKGSALWQGMPVCGTQDWGDPITLYDQMADRWLMSQFAFTNPAAPPFFECIAISATSDPTGPYHRYEFLMPGAALNDYPHFGVWPDAYYMTDNEFTGLSFTGAGNFAFDRASMLQGLPASYVYFHLDPPHGGFLPTDMDGPTPPPPGTPNFFMELWDNVQGQAAMYKFDVDWTNPNNSTFTGPTFISIAPFDFDLCATAREACIDQPNNAPKLEAIADRLMFRLAYRNFGTHESLVVNHTVDAGGGKAGVRWYEFRNPNGIPSTHQQGTFAPADGAHRWMGSAAMDQSGNIALGYTASSTTMTTQMRYTGRLAGDPLGQMTQGEGTFRSSGGVQTHSSGRWGDYSLLSVDPVDDCTFWYVSEWVPATSSSNWSTAIGAFKFPGCGTPRTPEPTIPPTLTPLPTASPTPDPCAILIGGRIDMQDPLQVGRLFRDGSPSTCANPKECPGLNAPPAPIHYDSYTFTNLNNSSACIVVELDAGTCVGNNFIFSAAYLGAYDPLDLCLNYLADVGGSPDPLGSYSFIVPAQSNFTIVVNETTPNLGCANYTMRVLGAGCQVPATATPTNTPVPPTNTPVPPTNTATNTATNTPVTPSATSTASNTPITPAPTHTPTETPTNTPTNTPSNTPTNTATNTPTNTATNTPTNTPTSTPTISYPPCSKCHLKVKDVVISCGLNGALQWQATVENKSTCAIVDSWTADLQVKTNSDNYTSVATRTGTTNFPPGDTVVRGEICQTFASNVRTVRLYYVLDEIEKNCKSHKHSQDILPCAAGTCR